MSQPVPQRYLPARPFPAYAFLPGRDPHPTGSPEGHSYTGSREAPARYLPAQRWSENEDFLYGCDLYNHGYLWEAHEAWEGLWHQAKHDPDQAALLQGLIQCAAACLKIPMQQPRGLARLAEAGTERLERVAHAHSGSHMGLDLFAFVRAFREFAQAESSQLDARPRLELDLA